MKRTPSISLVALFVVILISCRTSNSQSVAEPTSPTVDETLAYINSNMKATFEGCSAPLTLSSDRSALSQRCDWKDTPVGEQHVHVLDLLPETNLRVAGQDFHDNKVMIICKAQKGPCGTKRIYISGGLDKWVGVLPEVEGSFVIGSISNSDQETALRLNRAVAHLIKLLQAEYAASHYHDPNDPFANPK